jgi:hypothetical protein
MNYFKILPRPTFLLGSLDKELILSKKQIVRQKKEKSKEVEESRRTKIKELDVNSKENEINNTVGETERIFKILKKYYKRSKGNQN